MSDKDFSFTLSLSSKDTRIIKGVAICLMLWHHLFPNALYSGGSSAVVFMAAVGKICVSLFLLMSGLWFGLPVFKANNRF